jgi:ADP-heptose:LPS heptosyltransferase
MIRTDCRYFPGDRPCEYHKENHTACETCESYRPRGKAVLVVKFDAIGDVLRTTSILPSLHKTYGECFVTWITSKAAGDLFVGNTLVHEVLCDPSDYLPAVLSRDFDIVINPDTARRSCEIATVARAAVKYGFVTGPRGQVVPLNEAAEEWLRMGGSDPAKRANRKTYQQIIHAMCDLDDSGQHIVLDLTDQEDLQDGALIRALDLDPCKPVVGLNTGAGDRWKHKKWSSQRYIELVEMMLASTDASVVLLGGPGERERNEHIASFFGASVALAASQTLREFIRFVHLCDLVVTGDTLALHVAVALKKRVVAMFGPTSHHEIDLYGQGVKIVAPLDCICCYRPDCERETTCMDLITADEVMAAVLRELGVAVHCGTPS